MQRSRLQSAQGLRLERLLLMGLLISLLASCGVFYRLHSDWIEMGKAIPTKRAVAVHHALETTAGLRGGHAATSNSSSSFLCRDSSSFFSLYSDHKVGKLNDDYCDCSGTKHGTTDEPATSACSNILRERSFFCGWKPEDTKIYGTAMTQSGMLESYPYYPKQIYASRVHDGVCDCCDGSDEQGNPHLTCPNRCAKSIGEHERHELEKREAEKSKHQRGRGPSGQRKHDRPTRGQRQTPRFRHKASGKAREEAGF